MVRVGRRTDRDAVPTFRSVLRLERRVSHEGTVSVGAKFYNVPDTTRKRVFEVHALPEPIQIVEAGQLIAVHPVLEGRHQPARTGSGDG
jgi:hypothetical protein